MRGLIAALMLAGAASAQDVQIDRGIVGACFDTGRAARDSRPACVGDAAEHCQARPGGDTTLGIAECLMAETGVWGEVMQVALERKMQEFSQQDPSLSQALAETQAAWAAYRDAECGLQYRLWMDGSIRTIIAGHCHLQKTVARALELDMLGEME
jgi:uncharacterized protein YecT (DUF1311 family)